MIGCPSLFAFDNDYHIKHTQSLCHKQTCVATIHWRFSFEAMAAIAQDDLYKPLSTDFLVPTNREIGAIELENGGAHQAFAYNSFTVELIQVIPR